MTRKRKDEEFAMGLDCAACGKAMHIDDGLDPTPECNPCAQSILADAREENRRLKVEVRRLRALVKHAIEDCRCGQSGECGTCLTLRDAFRRERAR